jgi:hypothetical protein
MRVSFSGEPFGVVRPAGQAPDAAALHVDLDHRATATAVQALIENLVLTDVSGGLAARTALVTVAERHGRTHTVYFGLRPVEPPAPHRASAPRPPALTSGFQADVDSDSFVFAVPAKA